MSQEYPGLIHDPKLDKGGPVDWKRRRFLGVAAMTIAATHIGLYRTVNGRIGGPDDLAAFDNAPEWINSPGLTKASLGGRVVLVQFWTFTCINWLRTLPYVRAWAQKYKDRFVVIGVHTPEFAVEHDVEHVRRAVRQMKIDYPVVIDNNSVIWRAFGNQYWPALYFADARGRVRDHHFGEGEYERSEKIIQKLLGEAGAAAGQGLAPVDAAGVEAPADWENLRSQENYVGYDRTENFASPGGGHVDRRRVYSAPGRLALNQWALAGEWTMGRHATVLDMPNGRILYRFHARDLHLVMGPPHQGGPIRFRVSIDGNPPGPAHGVDVDAAGNGTVTEPRLYQLIRQARPIVDRQFEIEFLDAGVETLSFTFG
jgi:thiol-disulfide isomerase/thioredoxin